MSPRTGRPKEPNPNTINLTVRINKELNQELEEFCKRTQKTKGEIVRRGIRKVLSENEK